MLFTRALKEATLLKRHFRFLVEVYLKNKGKRMLYCPNLGPLTHCDVLGSRVWFSAVNHQLSLGYLDVWELVEVDGGWLVCVNPAYARQLVQEALIQGMIGELDGFQLLQGAFIPNIGYGIEMLLKTNGEQSFIYIQPVLCGDHKNNGCFPEEKGMNHAVLHELIALRASGYRAILLYCVQHNGIQCVRPAHCIDSAYGNLLQEAAGKGVELLAYRTQISLQALTLGSRIPVLSSENIILNK